MKQVGSNREELYGRRRLGEKKGADGKGRREEQFGLGAARQQERANC